MFSQLSINISVYLTSGDFDNKFLPVTLLCYDLEIFSERSKPIKKLVWALGIRILLKESIGRMVQYNLSLHKK